MNWGKGIILGMIVFMLFILSMSIKFFLLPADDYDHQYYENGLNFDHEYNKEVQVVKDHAEPEITVDGMQLLLTFKQPVNGTINFLRPSDNKLDKQFKLQGEKVTIPLDAVPRGQWQLVFNWVSDGKVYLYHKEIYVK